MHARERIGLLEKWMRRLIRRRKKNDPLRVLSNAFDDRRDCRRWRGPDEEHGVRAAQRSIERIGCGEIAAKNFDVRRQIRGLRVADECADTQRLRKLVHNLAADAAGGTDDEDAFHAGIIAGPRRLGGHGWKMRRNLPGQSSPALYRPGTRCQYRPLQEAALERRLQLVEEAGAVGDGAAEVVRDGLAHVGER